MDSGIYTITNRLTGDTYVGSAISIKERWRRHRKDLLLGKHHSRFLQRSWNKYGEERFRFRVIEPCLIKDLVPREDYYLLRMCPVFNTCPNAYSPLGRKGSFQERMRKSEYARANGIKPPPEFAIAMRRPVVAIDCETSAEIKRFESLSSACVWVGRTHRFASTIADCCNGGRHKTFAGYKWNWI